MPRLGGRGPSCSSRLTAPKGRRPLGRTTSRAPRLVHVPHRARKPRAAVGVYYSRSPGLGADSPRGEGRRSARAPAGSPRRCGRQGRIGVLAYPARVNFAVSRGEPTPGLEPGPLQLTQLDQTTRVRRAYGEALGQFLRAGPPLPSGQARHWRRAAPFSALTEGVEGGQEPKRADALTRTADPHSALRRTSLIARMKQEWTSSQVFLACARQRA